MYSNTAALASARVRNRASWTRSVLSEAKKLSMGALTQAIRQMHGCPPLFCTPEPLTSEQPDEERNCDHRACPLQPKLIAKPGDKGRRFPMAVQDTNSQALAARNPAVRRATFVEAQSLPPRRR